MAMLTNTETGRSKDYRSRLDVIRTPGMNHMSRTRTKIERFATKANDPVSGKSSGIRRKKKAYDGAYVAETRRQVQSGFAIAGKLMNHVHKFVVDMDLASLYPSIMLLQNLSPKTMIGKLFFKDKFTIPMYQINFIDSEEKRDYKISANDFFAETYVGKHWWAIAELFLNLPDTEAILNHIEENINQFAA